MNKSKLKKCKVCGMMFKPRDTMQSVCSWDCVKVILNKSKKKAWQKEKKVIKDKLKTHSEWLNELQIVFNNYIRERDKGKPCISSGKPLTGKFDAGHYFSVSSCPGLRFDEDNVHGQTVHDNQHLHGNLIEYGYHLIERIGVDRYNALYERRHQSNKMTIAEIKDKIREYKDKIKEFKK